MRGLAPALLTVTGWVPVARSWSGASANLGPLASVKTEKLTTLAERIATKVLQYCGGTASTGLLDVRQAREVEL
jgi:hypothetical protein